MTVLLLALSLLSWPVDLTLNQRRPDGVHRVRQRLQRAGPLGAVAAAVLVTVVLVGAGSLVVGCAWLLVATTTGILARNMMRARALRRSRSASMQAIRALGRELQAGSELSAAADAVLRDAPTGVVLLLRPWASAGAIDGVQVGGHDTGDGTRAALYAALRMSRQYGIPLAGLIFRVADGLADDLVAGEQRATAVAGARLSGYLLAGLPVVGVLLGIGMGANPLPVLFGGGTGSVLLAAGVALSCAGLLWSARIAR